MSDPLSSFSGISSGIDFKTLVDQVIKLERRPAERMQATVDANAKRKTALDEFQKALTALQDAATALRTGGPLSSFSVTATGAGAGGRAVLAATVNASAAPGSYQVVVSQLASAQKVVGTAGVAASGALGLAGTFAINGQQVAVTEGDTLAAIRDRINALPRAAGVQATIVTGGPSDARLVLTGTTSGAAAAFAVEDVSGTLAGTTFGLTGVPLVAAQDALLSVDGVPVQRATNSVADALPGVTLALSAEGTSTVQVDRQPGAATDAVRAMVDAFNAIVEQLRTQAAPGKPLAGESLLRTLRGQLADPLLDADATLPPELATLAAVGVSLQRDGTLRLDEAKLKTAVEGRLDDVRALFASRGGALVDLVKTFAAPVSGVIDARERRIEEQSAVLRDRIDRIDARLDKKRAALLAQYSRYEGVIGRLQSIGSSLGTQLSSLNRSSKD